MFKIFNILLFTIGMAYSQSSDLIFSDGNEYYNNNQFDDAIEAYESILNRGFYSVDLYYNLGNAYYRLDDFANARWSYEMGIIKDPRNKDIFHNLVLTKQKIPNTLEIPDSKILNMINNFLASFTYGDFIFFSSLMFLFYSISFTLYRMTLSTYLVGFVLLFYVSVFFRYIIFGN